jgi:two-component system sensor histidine kinase ChiS
MFNENEPLASGVHNSQEGIVLTTMNGKIEFVNSMVEQLLLFSRKELANEQITDVIIGDDVINQWDYIVETILEIGSFEFRSMKLMRKNGLIVPVKMTGFPLKRPSDKESWIVFYLLDITSEISISSELENKNVILAKENSELLKEKSNFKRISDMKTKFLGIASHELKTPLTSIKGYSEILLDSMAGELAPEVRRMIGKISNSADRLHNVVNDMLDVTRIEQNRLRLKPEELNLAELLAESAEELSHFFDKRDITPILDVDDDIPVFYGDRRRIHQVFTNLFSNAIKYSPNHTTITASILFEDAEFRITFKDEGVGISPIERESIFAPFYEVSNTTNHSSSDSKFMGGGTGLGLSIVKGIVQRHGGEIWVDSLGASPQNEHPGSEFHISFPLEPAIHWSDDETQIMKLHSIMEQKIDAVSDDGGDEVKKILIIDDDVESVEICRVIFNDKYEIVTSATGEVGLRIAFREKPNLILLNFYLPGLDGSQICRILKTQEETKNIPIAFFSAATQDNEIEQSYASGGDDYIVKPFSGKDLMEKVENLINIGHNR